MTIYVWRDDRFVNKKTGEPMATMNWGICAPMVVPDTPAYKSPLGDGVIEGRAARREHLKRNNCREVEPSEFKVQYKNERFARKHGLPFGERD